MDGITPPTDSQTRIRPPATRLLRTRLAHWMAAAAAGISRAAINRRVVRQLSAMSDRDLRDIGLVRQDVLDSQVLLLEGDATDFLIGRRDARRRSRGAVPADQRPDSFDRR